MVRNPSLFEKGGISGIWPEFKQTFLENSRWPPCLRRVGRWTDRDIAIMRLRTWCSAHSNLQPADGFRHRPEDFNGRSAIFKIFLKMSEAIRI
jgi:hypothetical protein